MKKFVFDLNGAITITLLSSSLIDAYRRFVAIFGEDFASDITDIKVLKMK